MFEAVFSAGLLLGFNVFYIKSQIAVQQGYWLLFMILCLRVLKLSVHNKKWYDHGRQTAHKTNFSVCKL